MGSILAKLSQKQKKRQTKKPDDENAGAWAVNTGTDLRVVLVGSGGVGKSSLVLQFVHNYFPDTYDPTIEDNFRKQIVVDEKCKMLDILDTAGQEEFRCMRDQWFRTGEAFVVVYSITDRNTFDDVNGHREFILTSKDATKGPMIMVGNKCDREDDRQVSTAEGKALADALGMPFFETSAKKRTNVDEAFTSLVRLARTYERD